MTTRFGHAVTRWTVGSAVARHHLVLTRDLYCACDAQTRVGWLTAMQAMDLRDGIAEIEVPVVVMTGSRDLLTPPGRSRELARVIPGARLVSLQGYGHTLPLEAPDQIANEVAELAGTVASTTLVLT
jgi:pimeloyl-ACP methyl ester carboxylesterase